MHLIYDAHNGRIHRPTDIGEGLHCLSTAHEEYPIAPAGPKRIRGYVRLPVRLSLIVYRLNDQQTDAHQIFVLLRRHHGADHFA
jgi:hypothetical protein